MNNEKLIAQAEYLIKNKQGTEEFIQAIKMGANDFAQALMDAGVDINVKSTTEKKNASQVACICGNSVMLQKLIEKKIQFVGDELELAVICAHANIVDMLLKNGITTDINPCLEKAVGHNDSKTCALLLEHGANSNTICTDYPENPVLIEAVRNNDERSVMHLIKHNANVNAVNLSGVTALMKAAKNGNCKIMEALLENGAWLHAKSHLTTHILQDGELIGGLTALDIAKKFNQQAAVQFLNERINPPKIPTIQPLMPPPPYANPHDGATAPPPSTVKPSAPPQSVHGANLVLNQHQNNPKVDDAPREKKSHSKIKKFFVGLT